MTLKTTMFNIADTWGRRGERSRPILFPLYFGGSLAGCGCGSRWLVVVAVVVVLVLLLVVVVLLPLVLAVVVQVVVVMASSSSSKVRPPPPTPRRRRPHTSNSSTTTDQHHKGDHATQTPQERHPSFLHMDVPTPSRSLHLPLVFFYSVLGGLSGSDP